MGGHSCEDWVFIRAFFSLCFEVEARGCVVNTSLVSWVKNKALPRPSTASERSIRRIFNNEQIIERYDKWLLICSKALNTRKNYTLDARQFAKFLMDKPLTAATKEDVRAFIAEMYAKGMMPQTMQRKLDSLRVLFDCLQLGNQVRASVPRLVSRRKLPSACRRQYLRSKSSGSLPLPAIRGIWRFLSLAMPRDCESPSLRISALRM